MCVSNLDGDNWLELRTCVYGARDTKLVLSRHNESEGHHLLAEWLLADFALLVAGLHLVQLE